MHRCENCFAVYHNYKKVINGGGEFMKVNKRMLIAIVLVIAIILGMTTQVSAVGENITTTVTTTPGNGGTVKPGDEITYTITMQNTSDAGYLFPTLMTQVPEGTEYVSCTASAMATGVENPAVDTETGIITCIGDSIHPNSDIVFTSSATSFITPSCSI